MKLALHKSPNSNKVTIYMYMNSTYIGLPSRVPKA